MLLVLPKCPHGFLRRRDPPTATRRLGPWCLTSRCPRKL